MLWVNLYALGIKGCVDSIADFGEFLASENGAGDVNLVRVKQFFGFNSELNLSRRKVFYGYCDILILGDYDSCRHFNSFDEDG